VEGGPVTRIDGPRDGVAICSLKAYPGGRCGAKRVTTEFAKARAKFTEVGDLPWFVLGDGRADA